MTATNSNPLSVQITSPSGGDLPAWVPLPGTYGVVGSNTVQSLDPCPLRNCTYSSGDGLLGMYTPWTGSLFAKNYAQYGAYLHGPGGGHGAYNGNETYAFVMSDATQAWQRITEPDVDVNSVQPWWSTGHPSGPPITDSPSGSVGANGWVKETGRYPDSAANGFNGGPPAPHSADEEIYVPGASWGNVKGALVVYNVTASGDQGHQTWHQGAALDLDTLQWSTLCINGINHNPADPLNLDAPDVPLSYYWSGCHDPINNRIVAIATGTAAVNFQTSVQIANITENPRRWYHQPLTILSGPGRNNPNQDGTSDYFPPGRLMVNRIGEGYTIPVEVWLFNLDTWQMKKAITVGTPAPFGVSMQWCSHPNVQKFYCKGVSTDVTAYTLAPPVGAVTPTDYMNGTWTWGSETFSAWTSPIYGAPGAVQNHPTSSGNSRYNSFRWNEMLKCFMWWNDHTRPGINLFRPAGAV